MQHRHPMRRIRFAAVCALLLVPLVAAPRFASALRAAENVPTVERWGVFEKTLAGPAEGNPYLDVKLSARFIQGEQIVEVPGFHDGGTTYKVRFSPPTLGAWRYETSSNRPGLDGVTGTFMATEPTAGNHGPVQVHAKYYFRYADGTPYHQYGTTCYAWIHQPEAMRQQTLKTLAGSPFNKIRYCVFPKAYAYNRNEPELFAFQKKADGKFDFTRPDPAFWNHLESSILALQRLGIEADLILWHPYDRWGFADMGKEHDDRYLHYAIARLSAYRNVWWSLANEFDLMAPGAMGGHRGDKQMADWDRFFQILQKHDPHSRLRGIHNCRGFYDHTKPWVTHTSVQHHDPRRVLQWREQYGRPVVIDECGYEGDIPQGWGNLSPQEMLRRFWLGTMTGGYVGHGETYKHPEDLLWWSKGGVLRGESPERIAWLRKLMAEASPFEELEPSDQQSYLLLSKPGTYYLVYCLQARPETLNLAGDRPYKVDRIDPWNMTVVPLGSAAPGPYSMDSPQPDAVYRFSVYAPGEKLRPMARASASPSAGTPPLAVRFVGEGDGDFHWDFGDGASSREASPTHVYQHPGYYTASLRVTNAEGGAAQALVAVAVDHDVTEALVRVGTSKGESPAITLHGAARRAAQDAIRLPGGEPWGWVQVGNEPLDSLRGLRSFTITGWLKPEQLQVGSGGNRIVFCLNRDHSGIDLVHLADGGMRLAVNSWPDAVRNDSSPGRLVVGRWTFFAVTYDATRAGENVRWYFSRPMDAPGGSLDSVTLDRVTSHGAGLVGSQMGPLAIGNFNSTMHSHGLDRQFRGEIFDVRIFGSRIGHGGALELDAIKKVAKTD